MGWQSRNKSNPPIYSANQITGRIQLCIRGRETLEKLFMWKLSAKQYNQDPLYSEVGRNAGLLELICTSLRGCSSVVAQPLTCYHPQIRYVPPCAPRHLHLYRPLTEQSFIKLFHTLLGRGTRGWELAVFLLLELHRIIPNSLQPTAENCWTPGVNVKGAAFHLLADLACLFILFSSLKTYTRTHTPSPFLHARFWGAKLHYYFYQ